MRRSIRRGIRAILGAGILITAAPGVASADFLGLAPGNYDVVLHGSAALCAGTDCVGTIHIPVTSVPTDEFDWRFEIGGHLFDWTDPGLATSVSPNGLNSCAIEGLAGAICAVNDSGAVSSLNTAPFLALFALGGSWTYTAVLSDTESVRDTFEARPASSVPEPSSALLLVSGGAAWVWRRRHKWAT